MAYSVFDSNNKKDHTSVKAFFDDAPTIARYDRQKYPWIEKLTDKQLGFFWRPEEVDIYKDAKDFKDLTPHEQHIFTSNLKRQILLDSVQGRAPRLRLPLYVPFLSWRPGSRLGHFPRQYIREAILISSGTSTLTLQKYLMK